jgi:hypothetical protein
VRVPRRGVLLRYPEIFLLHRFIPNPVRLRRIERLTMSKKMTCPDCGSPMKGLAKKVKNKEGRLVTIYRCSKGKDGRKVCRDQEV